MPKRIDNPFMWRKPCSCKVCGKIFYPENREKWAYKMYYHGDHAKYFCSWGHLRQYEKAVGGFKQQGRPRLPDEERIQREKATRSRYYQEHREEILSKRKERYWAERETG